MQSFPSTRLIILAACGTGVGPAFHGEGALSVARPFLVAGVPFVIATLWDVDDAASRAFFVALHRRLAAGQAPASALRETQIDAIADMQRTVAARFAWANVVLYAAPGCS